VPNNVYGWGIVDALAAVEAARPGAEVAKQATFETGVPAGTLVYALDVTNTSYCTLTHVALTDTVPMSTTFAWASGDYVYAGGVVTWTATSLAGGEALTAALAITVAHLSPGTIVVNDAYGVRADELPTPVVGAPLETVVPWRLALPLVFRNWTPQEGGDG
jgi:uncharacterized repeat protein (TIGR01451 family)